MVSSKLYNTIDISNRNYKYTTFKYTVKEWQEVMPSGISVHKIGTFVASYDYDSLKRWYNLNVILVVHEK